MKLKKFLVAALMVVSTTSFSQYNYGEALQKSILFYEAQQSGSIPDWNRLNWRGDSASNDGSDVGHNLTGGWYDAGDHVKFGFPMAYSATVLSWGAIEYKAAYNASGQMEHLKNNLRFVCDYFIKAHTAPNEFYGQLGNGSADHAWWGSAEVMRMDRPAYKIDAANPGSDLAGETAAALASASIVFADSDPAYSATLLSHAKELYAFADNYRGKYSDAITDATAFYNSWSGYQDELVWGAIWLYRATGDAAYLTKAKTEYAFLGNEGQSDIKAYKWGLAWDDKSYGCYILMADITDEALYKADAERHLDYWTSGHNGERIAYSPGGQAHLTTWGSLRHTANTSFLAFVYSDKVATTKATTYHNFAVSQLNYILGDNPNNRSYMMGFGNNPPRNAHHRTAHGTWTNNLSGVPENNRHILYGALVGGPGSPNDNYVDDRTDYVANEVACDYNAGFTGALAKMYSEYGGTPLTNFPQDETPVDEFLSDAKFNSNNNYGITVSVFARNHTAWPARATQNLSFRYYFDISEGVDAGFNINDYNINLSFSEGNGVLNVTSVGNNIYYAEVSFPGEDIRPGGESESRREAQVNIQVGTGMPWDNSNDFSAENLNTTTRINSENIPIYDGGVLVFGNEPNGGDTPSASFTYVINPDSGIAPLEVSFDASGSSDPNGDALFYTWDFGNGESSSSETPTITYTEPGTYEISLTVNDGDNTSSPYKQTITVEDGNIAPVAVIAASDISGIGSLSVAFDAAGSSDENGDTLTYSWDFGNGDTANGITTSYTFNQIKEYIVTLTVSDGSKSDTATVVITITDGTPVAKISSNLDATIVPFSVVFNASSSVDPSGDGLTYSWDFGNGETAATAIASTNYTAAHLGAITVTLTVTNSAGDTASDTVSFNATDGSFDCGFNTPTAEALQSINTSYENIFVLGDGGPNLDNVTNFTINWDASNNGLYQFSMNTSNGTPSWWNDLLPKVTQNFSTANPKITIANSGFPALDGSYYATTHDGNFVLVSTTSSYTIYFSKSSNAPECGGTVTPNTPPVAALSANPISGDAPLEVTFDASGSTDADGDTLTYSIDYGDNTSGTAAISTHTYTNTGTYTATVTVSDGNGGTDAASIDITVEDVVSENTPPIANLMANLVSGDTPLEVAFDASGSTDADGDTLTYSISYGDNTSGTAAISTHIYTTGQYTATVTVSDGKGGTDSASIDITVAGEVTEGCTFGTPTSNSLESLNTSYKNIHVLGTGGPNLDNITNFTINWDANNNGLYQFSMNTSDGQPGWYNDFLNKTTHNFNATNPGASITGSGIAGLDGAYYATIDAGNFVLVATSGAYTIYFSNSATAPNCDSVTPNEAPIANISVDTTSGEAPLAVVFNASGSRDPDGDASTLSYLWDFGDDTSATEIITNKNFDTVGSYIVTLTVTDVEGASDTKTINISATNGTVVGPGGSSDNAYIDRFIQLRAKIYDPANGYFSADGSPHHSVETLIVEAPDYGHESTSELYSYWMWLEAMNGRITGDWQPLEDVWQKTEQFIIPTNADQPTNAAYDPSSPAAYAPEFGEPSGYPAPLNFTAATGIDPVSAELAAAYGPDVYQMHWLLDNDNFYGYGNRGDGVSTPSYINTFQRGEQESVYETIPHPSWEDFSKGGESGFLPLFTLDANYSEQWRYTSATDADARAVQAMYWALQYVNEAESSTNVLDLDKASKMGDYLRLGMFDKYFKPMGVQNPTSGAGSGYDSAHYLMSWYISWGGSADTTSPWAFRISSSHCHFGYQNPVAAYALSSVAELQPVSTNGVRDWNISLGRQMEFYSWLQSAEGGMAGGATNSWNGDYSTYPSGKATFYDMAYDDNPVYHDPGSGTWFGWQAWSMERVAEYYYITNDQTAKTIMDKWTTWVESEVKLVGDDDFLIPATLEWTGQPDTWNPNNPGTNAGLHVTVTDHNVDLGIAASTAKALIYYAAATQKYATIDTGAQELAKEILDRMWTTYRDDKGLSSPESRGDFARIFEEEVFVPDGFTGVMGNGDVIDQGVSFLDIRSGYLDDPEYPNLLAAYNAGEDYTQRYHRTWAQMEIALANADYGFFFGEGETATSKTITNYKVNLYPNPSSDIVDISVKVNNNFDSITPAEKTFVLTNMFGEAIATKKTSEESSVKFDISKLHTGMYLINVYYGGQRIKTTKLMVN